MDESGRKIGFEGLGFWAICLLVCVSVLGFLMFEKPSPTTKPLPTSTAPQTTNYSLGLDSLCAAGERHTANMQTTESRLREAVQHCRQPVNQASCRREMTESLWSELSQPIREMDRAEGALMLNEIDAKCSTNLIDIQIRLSRLLSELGTLVGR